MEGTPVPVERRQRDLADLFDLEQVESHEWLGRNDLLQLPQLFGGQLVGQSLMAAGLSIGPDKRVHSLHTVFLRAGTSSEPVRYRVEDLHTGRSRSTRQVSALQGDRLLCRSLVSAGDDKGGISHARPAPDSGTVEESSPLSALAEDDGGLGDFWSGFEAIEIRVAPPAEDERVQHPAATHNIWMRAAEPLPDDQLIHRAAVAYASDLMLMGTAATAHGVPLGHERTLMEQWWGLSLDHTIWFQDDVRGDDWIVFEHNAPMAHASRALIQAAAFDRAGRAVCQITQEALLRRRE
ncbi:acyl-CoA thioesterase [Actinocorallia libanotica]|uniref:Acyl-CoA thioesterase II n=1 Tax=Actinocorallia libanotica TaxID=46162 RepID=A0ABP4BWU2_9ACTN